jgi:hypothetical protein
VVNIKLGYEDAIPELKHSTFQLKAIVFECKNEAERDAVIDQTRYKIVGEYLVSRRASEQQVRATKLNFEKKDNKL